MPLLLLFAEGEESKSLDDDLRLGKLIRGGKEGGTKGRGKSIEPRTYRQRSKQCKASNPWNAPAGCLLPSSSLILLPSAAVLLLLSAAPLHPFMHTRTPLLSERGREIWTEVQIRVLAEVVSDGVAHGGETRKESGTRKGKREGEVGRERRERKGRGHDAYEVSMAVWMCVCVSCVCACVCVCVCERSCMLCYAMFVCISHSASNAYQPDELQANKEPTTKSRQHKPSTTHTTHRHARHLASAASGLVWMAWASTHSMSLHFPCLALPSVPLSQRCPTMPCYIRQRAGKEPHLGQGKVPRLPVMVRVFSLNDSCMYGLQPGPSTRLH